MKGAPPPQNTPVSSPTKAQPNPHSPVQPTAAAQPAAPAPLSEPTKAFIATLSQADKERYATRGYQAAHYAVLAEDIAYIKIMSNDQVNAPAARGFTALHLAVDRNNVAMADALLKARADTNAVRTKIETDGIQAEITALHSAASIGNPDMVKLLIDAGASHAIQAIRTGKNYTCQFNALHVAACKGRVSVIEVLKNAGVDIEVVSTTVNMNVRKTETALSFTGTGILDSVKEGNVADTQMNRFKDAFKALIKAGASTKSLNFEQRINPVLETLIKEARAEAREQANDRPQNSEGKRTGGDDNHSETEDQHKVQSKRPNLAPGF